MTEIVLAKPTDVTLNTRPNLKLRDYQKQVIADLYRFFRQGFKAGLLYGPTGCGKTAIATKIIADAVARGRRVLFCCHRKKLVGQTQESLLKFYSIESGIIWADNPVDYSLSVQIVASRISSILKKN